MSQLDEFRALREEFGFDPTQDQVTAMQHLAAFGISVKPNPLYLLMGYAGTGKTSLISAFTSRLRKRSVKFVLMAPTGRAAKVLSQYSGYQAFTIHRRIYMTAMTADGRRKMTLAPNRMEHTVFIVDEASMISDNSPETGGFESQGLLDDLISFVFSRPGNKLLFVGDTAQLPPVHLNISPALDVDYLKSAYSLTAYAFEMKDVMRQAQDSGILLSATRLRYKIGAGAVSFPFFARHDFFSDVEVVEDYYRLEELFQQAFSGYQPSDSIVVTRSNKSANHFNRQIRNNIQQREAVLEAGDRIMIVKNNYFWLDPNSKAGFIANGDLAEVVRLTGEEALYGFHFADAEIRLVDYPEEKEMMVKLLLDTLDANAPSLTEEDQRNLFDEVERDYQSIPNRKKRLAAMQKDPYFNALQIKYAYAMTCHKTQGGQWAHVFIDQGYVQEELLDVEYLRWLYTAFTRATEKVYLLGFQEVFFE